MSGKLRDIDKRKVNKRLLNAAKLSSYRKDKATREEVASILIEILPQIPVISTIVDVNILEDSSSVQTSVENLDVNTDIIIDKNSLEGMGMHYFTESNVETLPIIIPSVSDIVVQGYKYMLRNKDSRSLYIKYSTHKRFNKSTNKYDINIGRGLFAKKFFKPRDVIAEFEGEIINGAEFLNRCKAGKGSYVIKFTDEVLLDCYANRNSSEFLASYANSALNCKDMKTNINSVNNSVICLDQTNKRARLICIKKITINSEIFCSYSSSYKYP